EGRLDGAGQEALAALDADLDSDAALARAVALLSSHAVLDEARALAQRWADDAVAELAGLPDGPVKDALTAFAGLMVDRLA
ncbi:MAG TPA: polyprenyl synthetase family protein, partial [Actinomycetaceae bacterium]|nr:polyprenyl synthetase family protein [Actinomycetaceae bacterium]